MSEKSNSTLRSMVLKGKNYREDYELEYFGETTTLSLRPLKDTEFIEIAEKIDDVVDGDFEDELEDLEDDEIPDEADFSSEFVELMRDAAKMGIDPESVGEKSEEDVAELLDEMIGGVSIEIGSEVMEITSNLQDAERFRRVG